MATGSPLAVICAASAPLKTGARPKAIITIGNRISLSVFRLPASGPAGQEQRISVYWDVPVPLGVGIARVPRPRVDPPAAGQERQVGPSGRIGAIGDCITPGSLRQIFDDAVVAM